MNTLKKIDTAHPITLMAYSFGRVTDTEIVDMAMKLDLPQLLNMAEPTEGAVAVEIADASGFIGWLQSSQWADVVEHDLQGIANDDEGRPLLTTWISAADFEQLVSDAQTTPFGYQLRRAMEAWKALGLDQVYLDGVELPQSHSSEIDLGLADSQSPRSLH